MHVYAYAHENIHMHMHGKHSHLGLLLERALVPKVLSILNDTPRQPEWQLMVACELLDILNGRCLGEQGKGEGKGEG